MAELYRELRDRTASGTHLAARAHHLDEPEGGAPPSDETLERPNASAQDPLVEAAFELLKIVDRDGEVTIDRAPSNGSCQVALETSGPLDAGVGVSRCFVSEPAHEKGPSRTKGIPLPF